MNKKSLLAGIILGIAVVVSLGIVYIDTIQNYWYVNGGFVKLVVSNQTQQAAITISTNTFSMGINSNNVLTTLTVQGRNPSNVTTSLGTSAALPGGMKFIGGKGGGTTIPTTGTGNTGGALDFVGGAGGDALSATTNATGGAGGGMSFSGGAGGGTPAGAATNATTGGGGGNASMNGGNGGSPATASTNTVGGTGGSATLSGGAGGSPTGGWARKGGNGGILALTGGNGANGTRTNAGNGASVNLTAGDAGGVATAPGNPGSAGHVNLTGGDGDTGDTNSNGGSLYLRGGDPGSTATPGNTYIGRNVAGSARGGLVVGLGEATVTNVLSATATLDFPSLAAGTVADLAITVAGSAAGDVVTLAVPLESVTNCMWMAFASNGVVWVRAANNQLVTAQDPNSGVFRVVNHKFQ